MTRLSHQLTIREVCLLLKDQAGDDGVPLWVSPQTCKPERKHTNKTYPKSAQVRRGSDSTDGRAQSQPGST